MIFKAGQGKRNAEETHYHQSNKCITRNDKGVSSK